VICSEGCCNRERYRQSERLWVGVVTERDADRESDCGWERGGLNTDGKRFTARVVDI